MKIVCAGQFLAEGLRQAGQTVIPLALREDADLNALIEAACPDPDWVLLEVWGRTALPRNLAACRHRLAVFCIDTPLNAFWLRPLLQLCDAAFVDQRASVAALARAGITAHWLPLCVQENDFRAPVPPERFLTFVGRITPHRRKRANLLRLLQRHTPVQVVQDVSRARMQDLFARSQVVLNENLFSGLTLRVLQGLASGALVLTEAGGDGVDAHFTDDVHLACYGPDTLLPRLADIRARPEHYQTIARAGQAACRQAHTSAQRAREFLDILTSGQAGNPRRTDAVRRLAEAKAKYRHCLRFGGSLAAPMQLFGQAAGAAGTVGQEASFFLGHLFACQGDTTRAGPFLAHAARHKGVHGFLATATQALIALETEGPDPAAALLEAGQAALPRRCRRYDFRGAAKAPVPRAALLVGAARLLLALGRDFEPGFFRQEDDRYPDTAFGYAVLAWQAMPSQAALDIMLACARRTGIEPEILPILKRAIGLGLATDAQIATAADLAWRAYDPETARDIASALARRLSSKTPPSA